MSVNSKRANLEWNTAETNEPDWGGRLSLFGLEDRRRLLYDRNIDSEETEMYIGVRCKHRRKLKGYCSAIRYR